MQDWERYLRNEFKDAEYRRYEWKRNTPAAGRLEGILASLVLIGVFLRFISG